MRQEYVFVVVRFGVRLSDVLLDRRCAVSVRLDFLQNQLEQSAQAHVALFEVLQTDASDPRRASPSLLGPQLESVSHAQGFFLFARNRMLLLYLRSDCAVSLAELSVDCSVEDGFFGLVIVRVEESRLYFWSWTAYCCRV